MGVREQGGGVGVTQRGSANKGAFVQTDTQFSVIVMNSYTKGVIPKLRVTHHVCFFCGFKVRS